MSSIHETFGLGVESLGEIVIAGVSGLKTVFKLTLGDLQTLIMALISGIKDGLSVGSDHIGEIAAAVIRSQERIWGNCG